MKTYILDCEKWVTAGEDLAHISHSGELPQLLTAKGTMCCLGQFLNQDRVALSDLGLTGEPCEVFPNIEQGKKYDNIFVTDSPYEMGEAYAVNSKLSSKLISINDHIYYSLPEKVYRIWKQLEQKGATLRVVNIDFLKKHTDSIEHTEEDDVALEHWYEQIASICINEKDTAQYK